MNNFDAEAFSEAMNAESFDVEFEEWGKQEMKTHGKDISFNDWLMEEAKSHGDMPLVEWAKDEEKSHDERYGAESFDAEFWEYDFINQQIETDDRNDERNHRVVGKNINKKDGELIVELHNDNQEGQNAETFHAESDRPLNKTVIGLLGIGALGAIFAPKQIKALFDKLK